jgi:hypothetical protein
MGERKVAYGIVVGKPDGDYLEDLGVDGRVILKLIFIRRERGMDWIDVAQYRERYRILVNAVMNLRVP